MEKVGKDQMAFQLVHLIDDMQRKAIQYSQVGIDR